uniref:Uncharacterized protein n=1 Tax=Anguilla anguilla TaxID=7936 RepID=A0A0E9S1A7_ANGAN
MWRFSQNDLFIQHPPLFL